MPPVTCHQRQQPQPQTLPQFISPLCTLCWFTKTEPRKPKKNQNSKKKLKPLKMGIFFFNFSNAPLDQKSPALLVPVADGGDNIHQTTDPQTSQLID